MICGIAAGPAASRRFRNWACVHTDATVVISLITTFAGGLLPTTVISAIAGLLHGSLIGCG